MKSAIAIALAILAGNTMADTFAISGNTGGGQIILTDKQGNCNAGSKMAYSRVPGGSAIYGCWSMPDDWILVRWSDGDFRMYDPRNFDLQGKYAAPGKTKGTQL